MGKADKPPVPPAGRSDKGPDVGPRGGPQDGSAAADERQRNLEKQGRQGNIKQNTTNQGYQQDR